VSRRALLPLVLVCGLVACAEDIARPGHNEAAAAKPRTAHPAARAQAGEEEGPPAVEFQEADFAETERSRDPFRSFAKLFSEQAKSKIKSQRDVVLEQYSVDELRLIGIVTRIEPAKAMMVDPTGKGHVISRGQFIGRPEIVQGGSSGADYEINWRVQRIRDSDIVLVREDPANPDVPTATRVSPLRPEDTG
jgi:type IV pilus assembly protein PilP